MSEAAPTDSSIDTGMFKEMAQSLDCAIAVADIGAFGIVFENARFFRWFPTEDEGENMLSARIPGLNTERATSRVESGRSMTFDTTVDIDDQEQPFRVTVSPFPNHDEYVLVQAHSTFKEMEIQYMLDSYSRMAERERPTTSRRRKNGSSACSSTSCRRPWWTSSRSTARQHRSDSRLCRC